MTDTATQPVADTAATSTDDEPAYDVPADATAHTCSYCGRPFARESWLALHRGLAHPNELGDEEIEAFRAAHSEEEESLSTFRLQALGALVLLYFGFLMVYALV
ncbi:DNA-binding protein [Haloarcula taiwanensis]|uniref:DNA-binding protein n=1 Tax=Haloarcula taiwanensis TaxID=1932004 RepID=A0A2H4ZZ46_9EURY|nr:MULTISPECIES: C2H2-type zinc finger protein [Haloarcula]AUG47756.1 DNA-binding protein [Haloarcula taiwanensis]RLM39063.1 C2H2-type zinc finger protein [Haloarcula sp. Atlit-120R]RLM47007.1 C2H2-type zinc finger protein [Haloarcula sp. Atlit-47R]